MTSQQDVKLKVVNTNIVKRILVPQSFTALKEQASALVQNKVVKITYLDSDGDNVEVVDESDLKIAFQYAQKIIFLVAPVAEVAQADVEMINTSSNKQAAEQTEIAEKGKQCRKQGGGNKGMNRKALKNLIQQELQSQSKEIFKEILKNPHVEGLPEEEESKQLLDTKPVVHDKVECDGCGVNPIGGIRYKCAVCKNFDYCANCEERLAHEHPFLKIRNPSCVPDVMITILPENAGEEHAEPVGEQQMPFGFGGRGGRGRRGGGKGGRGGFKKMMCNFMEQMGINVAEVKEQWKEGGCDTEDACGWAKKDWKLKRVEIVSVPTDVLEACPGRILLPSIELMNGTHWTWKAGCVLTLAQEAGADFENLPIEMINVPVDQELKGKSSMKMTVPLKVHDHAVASEQVHQIKLAMRGPGGFQFGNVITLKMKIVRPNDYNDEIELYKLALKLQEQGLGSFDDCVLAVKNSNCDEQAAIFALQRK